MMDFWLPPKPAIIISAPKELLPPTTLGLTMMARTWALRTRGASAGAATYSNLTWRGTQTSSSVTTVYTFSSLTLGTSAADRWVIVGVVCGSAPSGVTVGGVTATNVVQDAGAGSASIWAANVPSGTTGSIVVTTGGDEEMHVGYWTVNMPSGTPADTSSGANDFDTTASCTGVDIPANGFSVQCSWGSSTSDQTHSIDSSFTEQAETFVVKNGAFSHRETVSAVTGVTVTSTWSAVSGGGSTACCASWQ